jgi:hypothetical protein
MAVVWIIPFFVAPGLIEPDDGYSVYGREVTQGEQSSGDKTLAPDIREARRHECIIGGDLTGQYLNANDGSSPFSV